MSANDAMRLALAGVAGGLALCVSIAVHAASSTPTADFTDNHDGTVTHKLSGLTWKRCAEGQSWTGTTCSGSATRYTWYEATTLAGVFAGRGDWRVPTIAELVTVIDWNGNNPPVNTVVFPNPPTGYMSYFWSSTPISEGAGSAWYFDYYFGAIGSNVKTDHFTMVRLVRGGQPVDPWVSPDYTPSGDFTDHGNGTVTHRRTGLTWKRCAEGLTWTGSTCQGTHQFYTWNEARALTQSYAGHADWRLPDKGELLSIVEWNASQPAVNAAVFPGISSWFWTSSPYFGNGIAALSVNFSGISGLYLNDKSYSGRVLLVRGTQPDVTATATLQRVFNWAEVAYASFFSPPQPVTQLYEGYTYRYYGNTGNFLAVKEGGLFVLGPATGNQILNVGRLPGWLREAEAAGF